MGQRFLDIGVPHQTKNIWNILDERSEVKCILQVKNQEKVHINVFHAELL